jgi:Tfp pilus assembly protein FimT
MSLIRQRQLSSQSGQSLLEMIVVMIILIILTVIALPQLRGSRELTRWSGLQREIVAELRNARQAAISQRQPFTLRYDDANKRLIIYGGAYGAAGAATNRRIRLARGSLSQTDVVYGRPPGFPATPLADATNLTPLTAGELEVTFQPDGSVVDAGGNPVATGMFLHHAQKPNETAFAVTVLGFGGRVKLWRYNPATNSYAE